MKTFQNRAAQGDLYLIRVDSLPANAKKVDPKGEHYIVAHSETGHHHVVEADPEVGYYVDPDNDRRAWLVVDKIIGAQLQHLRTYDTHETLLVPKGIIELRRQVEYTPQGLRKVVD